MDGVCHFVALALFGIFWEAQLFDLKLFVVYKTGCCTTTLSELFIYRKCSNFETLNLRLFNVII